MLFIFMTGFILLWAKEETLREDIKESMKLPSMKYMFDNIRAVQEFVFVVDGYCNKVKRLQDCEMDELVPMVLSGSFNRTLIGIAWVFEEIVNCSGVDSTPLMKYFFTGRWEFIITISTETPEKSCEQKLHEYIGK